MDRFEILRDVDPCASMPKGDGGLYLIMSQKYIGWRIDYTSLILDMSENAFNFLIALKDKKINITTDMKTEIFKVLRVTDKKYYTDKRTRSKRVKAQFEGQIFLPF